MPDTLDRVRTALEAELETARADLKSSAKLPDGYAHGFANGRVAALERALEIVASVKT